MAEESTVSESVEDGQQAAAPPTPTQTEQAAVVVAPTIATEAHAPDANAAMEQQEYDKLVGKPATEDRTQVEPTSPSTPSATVEKPRNESGQFVAKEPESVEAKTDPYEGVVSASVRDLLKSVNLLPNPEVLSALDETQRFELYSTAKNLRNEKNRLFQASKQNTEGQTNQAAQQPPQTNPQSGVTGVVSGQSSATVGQPTPTSVTSSDYLAKITEQYGDDLAAPLKQMQQSLQADFDARLKVALDKQAQETQRQLANDRAERAEAGKQQAEAQIRMAENEAFTQVSNDIPALKSATDEVKEEVRIASRAFAESMFTATGRRISAVEAVKAMAGGRFHSETTQAQKSHLETARRTSLRGSPERGTQQATPKAKPLSADEIDAKVYAELTAVGTKV